MANPKERFSKDKYQKDKYQNDSQVAAVKMPPHSIEAEASVLGGLLLDNSAWDRIGDVVRADDFYRADHRIIFEAMRRRWN